MTNLTSPNNQFGGRDRGNSHHGGYHNFHPIQQESGGSNNNAGHSIIHGSNHFNQFNMNRERENSRHLVGASHDQVNLMASNDSSIVTAVSNNNNNQNSGSG